MQLILCVYAAAVCRCAMPGIRPERESQIFERCVADGPGKIVPWLLRRVIYVKLAEVLSGEQIGSNVGDVELSFAIVHEGGEAIERDRLYYETPDIDGSIAGPAIHPACVVAFAKAVPRALAEARIQERVDVIEPQFIAGESKAHRTGLS